MEFTKKGDIRLDLFFLSFGSAQDIGGELYKPSVYSVSLELPFKMTDIVAAMVRLFIVLHKIVLKIQLWLFNRKLFF